MVVVVILSFSVLLASILVYRSATNEGELVLRTKGIAGEVLIKQNGKVIARLDTTLQKRIDLRAGEYESALAGNQNEVKLSVERFTIQRGKQTVVTLEPLILTIEDGLVVCPKGRGQYKTLAEAVAHARAGMRLLIRPGVYRESVTVSKRAAAPRRRKQRLRRTHRKSFHRAVL